MDVAQAIAERIAEDASTVLLCHKDESFTCADMQAFHRALGEILTGRNIASDRSIAIVTRNRISVAAATLSLMAWRRSITMIYSHQSPTALSRNVEAVSPVVLIADDEDWSPELIETLKGRSILGLSVSRQGGLPVVEVEGGDGSDARIVPRPGTVEVRSSGTTGEPKLIPLNEAMLARAALTGQHKGIAAGDPLPRQSPELLVWALGGIAGTCVLVGAFCAGRIVVINDKFDPARYLADIARHRPTVLGGPPVVLQMLLDTDAGAADMSGVTLFTGGSAALTPEMQTAFEKRFGIPVLWSYGATEFAGSVANWNSETYAEFGESKRGSVGRILPGLTVRIIDPDTGAILPRGQVGRLEAIVPELGPDWISTNDLALIDDDDFLYHRGRADGAIVRGGTKVLPETIATALREHPAVWEAAAVGIRHERLGQVPAAAVQLREGFQATPEALIAHLTDHLPRTHIPVRIDVFESLPRTRSMKVDLGALKAHFGPAA